MLKTVSSITNAIGALNYKGTWDANANVPPLASGVGTKGDYYVVGTAGSTTLDGISNWGIGDWAVFNGSVWQRVEGGANLNGVDLSVSGTSTLSGLTASTALALNASKEIVSVTNTGTGNNVLATIPTFNDQTRLTQETVPFTFLNKSLKTVENIASAALTTVATITLPNNTYGGRILFQVTSTNADANLGYSIACSVREILFTKYSGTPTIISNVEISNNQGSINAGVINVTIVTTAVVSGNTILLQATPTATGAVGSTSLSLQTVTEVVSSNTEATLS